MIYTFVILLTILRLSLGKYTIKTQSTCENDLPWSEYNALYSFYNATDGKNWCNLNTLNLWTFPSDVNAPCTDNWIGIICGCSTNDNGTYQHIYQIDFNYDSNGNCLYGTIPSSIADLSYLSGITIGNNFLYGHLPPELANLKYLISVNLQNNFLTGKFPKFLYNLSSLYDLELTNNLFNGPIPNDINKMYNIGILDIRKNYFTGTFPTSLAELTKLIVLELENNFLNGTIPSEITKLQLLQIFTLSNNGFYGNFTIPISKFTNMNRLEISYNYFGGDVSFISNTSRLRSLDISGNKFTGSLLPFCSSNGLQSLIASSNRLTGELLSCLFDITSLFTLDFSNNYLSGSFPNTIISQTSYFSLFNISHNHFIGSLPASLGHHQILSFDGSYNYFCGSLQPNIFDRWEITNTIILNNNYLSGSLPNSITKLTFLQSLQIQHNLFSSSIPSSINELSNLFDLYLFNNLFTGTIPPSFGDLRYAAFIWFSNNFLTGTLPSSLNKLSLLTQVLVNNNQLSGNPFTILNFTSQPILQVINIASNLFTGTIPSDLFQFPKLSAIAAVSNCLHGKLPNDVCDSPAMNSLSVLALDGVGSNQKCHENVKLIDNRPPGVNGINEIQQFGGTIPRCFMTIPYLQTLHLSGNGLTGTIPSIHSNSSLTDLSLSNNALTGSIPNSIQSHEFERLDLTNNRLDGTLTNEFRLSSNQTMLTLSVNRLSGSLPSSIVDSSSQTFSNLINFSILTSNIFDCTINEIPTKDSYAEAYYCGSYTFNLSSYVWIGLTMTIATIILGIIFILKPSLEVIRRETFSDPHFNSHINIHSKSTTEATTSSISRTFLVRLRDCIYKITVRSIIKIKAAGDLVVLWWATATLPFISPSKSNSINRELFGLSQINLNHDTIDPTNPIHTGHKLITTPVEIYDNSQMENDVHMRNNSNNNINHPIHRTVSVLSSVTTVLIAESLWTNLYETKSLLIILQFFRYIILLLSILLLVILIPVYITLNEFESISTYQYGYIVSITFIHGIIPVIFCGSIVIVVFVFLTCAFNRLEVLLHRNMMSRSIPTGSTGSASVVPAALVASVAPTSTSTSKLTPILISTNMLTKLWFCIKRYLLLYTFHLINIVTTITVNVAYVNAILTYPNLTRNSLVVLQICVGAFKLFWNVCYIPAATQLLQSYMPLSRTMQNRLIMSIVNYLVAPCIATLVTNQSCFYYVFVSHSEVTSSADLIVCTTFDVNPVDHSQAICANTASTSFSTSYYPSFQYSYACGTAFLVTYVPVFMYTYIAAGILAPIVGYLLSMNPSLLRPKLWVNNLFVHKLPETLSKQQTEDELRNSIIHIKGRGIVVSLMLHLTVLLTFGIACPILGITIIFTILNDSIMFKLLVGRYLSITAWIRQLFYTTDKIGHNHICPSSSIYPISSDGYDQPGPNSSYDLKLIEEDNRDAWLGLFKSFTVCIMTTNMFWALLFFDMIADDYGISSGMTTSLCYGIITPVLIITYLRLMKKYPFMNIMTQFPCILFPPFFDIDAVFRNDHHKTSSDQVPVIPPHDIISSSSTKATTTSISTNEDMKLHGIFISANDLEENSEYCSRPMDIQLRSPSGHNYSTSFRVESKDSANNQL